MSLSFKRVERPMNMWAQFRYEVRDDGDRFLGEVFTFSNGFIVPVPIEIQSEGDGFLAIRFAHHGQGNMCDCDG